MNGKGAGKPKGIKRFFARRATRKERVRRVLETVLGPNHEERMAWSVESLLERNKGFAKATGSKSLARQQLLVAKQNIADSIDHELGPRVASGELTRREALSIRNAAMAAWDKKLKERLKAKSFYY